MLDKKICPCSKDNYTRFLSCCCDLKKGVTIWCAIQMAFALASLVSFVFYGSMYLPVLEFIAAWFGLVGASRPGRHGARLLRLYALLYITSAFTLTFFGIAMGIMLISSWISLGESANDAAYIWTLIYFGCFYVFHMSVLHLLISSVESLAKQKEQIEQPPLPTFQPHIQETPMPVSAPIHHGQAPYPGQAGEHDPHVIYVQHQVMDPTYDGGDSSPVSLAKPTATDSSAIIYSPIQ